MKGLNKSPKIPFGEKGVYFKGELGANEAIKRVDTLKLSTIDQLQAHVSALYDPLYESHKSSILVSQTAKYTILRCEECKKYQLWLTTEADGTFKFWRNIN